MTIEESPQFESGRFLVALACERRVRIQVSVLHGPARELCHRHNLQGNAARLGAEGLVAASLLSAHIKGEERLTLLVDGTPTGQSEPRFRLRAEVDGDGSIRARFEPSQLPDFQSFDAVFSVLKAVGPREIYRGHAGAQQEDFSAALQRYFTTSDQVDGRVRILAEVDENGRLYFAAGMLVERLPGMEEEEFSALFDPAMSQDFQSLMTAFAFGQVAGQAVEVLDWRDYRYRCTCSRSRVEAVLRAMGSAEIRSLKEEMGYAEVTCHFCNNRYVLDADALELLAAELEN